MKSKLFFLIVLLLSVFSLQAQILEPVKWNTQLKNEDNNNKEIIFHAKIENGWHLYGLNIPEGGPRSTRFVFEKIQGAILSGNIHALNEATTEYSPLFELKLSWYSKSADFSQKIEITDPKQFSISGYIEYQACNDLTCLPPTKYEFQLGNITEIEESNNTTNTDNEMRMNVFTPKVKNNHTDFWTPVINEMNNIGENSVGTQTSLWFIFISGFIGGLLALLTPCVWPMIPMTVSFFLKKSHKIRLFFNYPIFLLHSLK